MTRRYIIHLLVVTLAIVALSFVVLWTMPQHFLVVMPFVALYFAVVTGVLHHVVTRAAQGDPRRFIRIFLSATVITLFLHLVVMAVYMFTHVEQARLFAISFAIGYLCYLVFETAELVSYVKHYQKEH